MPTKRDCWYAFAEFERMRRAQKKARQANEREREHIETNATRDDQISPAAALPLRAALESAKRKVNKDK